MNWTVFPDALIGGSDDAENFVKTMNGRTVAKKIFNELAALVLLPSCAKYDRPLAQSDLCFLQVFR